MKLSYPSKLSVPGFSLPNTMCPARDYCLECGASEGKVAICSECYAGKGRFKFPSTQGLLSHNLDWWRKTPPLERAESFVSQLRKKRKLEYFRCYVSGDVDLTAGEVWLEVVRRLPSVKLWVPTRTWVFDDFLPMLRKMNEHPRIVVRPSALCFDEPPPMVDGLAAGGASKHKEELKADHDCPGKCGPCRLCWTAPDVSVNFKKK